METTRKTAELIHQRIEEIPVGEPFTPTALLECGTRASVDQNLSRLVKARTIERVTRGVFVTSGPSKRIRVGNMEIRLQHVCQRKLALAGRPAGLALSAMWYLGKTEVTPALVEKIRRKLGASEFEVLKSATSSMPARMSDAIFRSERTAAQAGSLPAPLREFPDREIFDLKARRCTKNSRSGNIACFLL